MKKFLNHQLKLQTYNEKKCSDDNTSIKVQMEKENNNSFKLYDSIKKN